MMLQLRPSAQGPSHLMHAPASQLSSSSSLRGTPASFTRQRAPLLPARPYLQSWTSPPGRSSIKPVHGSSAQGPSTKPSSNGAISLDTLIDLDVFDKEKEKSRVYRRTVFDFQRWRAHRSAQRYLRHLQGLFGSRIVRGVSGPLTYTLVISTGLGAYETARALHYLPAEFPSLSVTANQPFSLSSFALSLLLVFRTNSSYNRWWEARKLWGGVVNRSRDLVRQGVVFFDDEEDAALLEMLRRWTAAFSRSLTAHLRDPSEHDLSAELKDVLPAEELSALIASPHRPNFVLGVLSDTVKASTINQMARLRMDENLTFFEDALGACERILRTPIPLTYTRHTSRFLTLYVTFVPFTLWGSCGWGSVPISVTIAFLLLGIEEIGVQIEEPFGILPLEVISDTIEGNVKALVAARDTTHKLVDGLAGFHDERTRDVPDQFIVRHHTPIDASLRKAPRGSELEVLTR